MTQQIKILPPDQADATAYMRTLFLRTEQEIINVIKRKRKAGYVDYAEVAALERVQKILQSMIDQSWAYVPTMIEKIFYHSDKASRGYSNARKVTETFSAPRIAIIQQLTDNLLGELTEASETVYESVQKVYTIARLEADPFRETALKQVLRKETEGTPWINSSQSMVQEMQNKGITAFVDKAGRNWSLQSYGNMAVRTTARQAQVAALLTADEHDLWQIVRVGSTCKVCAALEGRIYSKSGMNPDFPPLSLAFGKVDPDGADDLTNTYLNIHPNCLHSLVRYTTIGKTEKQIQKDKDFSDPEKNPIDRDPRTKKQIAAYREKERNRRRLLADMRQHREYRSLLGNEIPKEFGSFQKHKQQKDDIYRGWEKKYRKKNLSESMLHKMDLKLPDNIMNVKGITEDDRIEIEKTISSIEKRYDLRIAAVEVESFGRVDKGTYFAAGAYLENGSIKMGMVINRDIDYTNIHQEIARRYKTGFFASKTLEDCVWHEMAHVLTFQGCKTPEEYQRLHSKIKSAFISGISGYADRTKDGTESLAEAFVRYKNGEKIPIKARWMIRQYIERWKK